MTHSKETHKSGTDRNLLAVLMVMTAVTGFVDAVSYLSLGHVFTANMTGNVVLLGFALAGAPHLSIARAFVSLWAFLLGAIVGGRLGVRMAARRRRWLLTTGITEAVLLLAAAVAAVGYGIGSDIPLMRLYPMVVLTALAMGLRTATVRRLGVRDVTTVVLTTTLVGLAADSSLAGGANSRVGRRVASVLSMIGGASIGALLLRLSLAVPLLVGATAILVATVAYCYSGPIEAVPFDDASRG